METSHRKPADRRHRHMVSINDYAYNRLLKMRSAFQQHVADCPQLYPHYADRQISMSDFIVLLLEGKGMTQ